MRERGAALFLALLWIIVVSAGSAIIFTNTTSNHQATVVHKTQVHATWAVEGALATTLHALRVGETPADTLQIGGEDVRISVTKRNNQWLVHARTHPTTAAIDATYARDDSGRITQTDWTRVR